MRRFSTRLFRIFAAIPCILASIGVAATTRAQTAAPPLKLLQTIPLPGFDGAMDHMDMDVQGQRLFIPAEQAGLVEVVDVKNGKRLRTISSVRWPSTIAYHPQSDEIFVSDREDGSVKVISGKTYELVKTIQLTKGADNATYDPDTQSFYVA
jgi:DNA-binding beta-propeller fold protein YncE